MLVFKYGLIGVVVGTIISTMVRALELIIYSCKKIINGNVMTSIMKIVICITEVLLFAPMINKIINYSRIHSFMSFISYSFLTACLSSLLVVGLNIVIYWKTIRKFGSYFKMFKNNNGRQ